MGVYLLAKFDQTAGGEGVKKPKLGLKKLTEIKNKERERKL